MQESSSKRRFYLNRKTDNNSYSSPIKYQKNGIKDNKASNNINTKGRFIGLNTDSFDLMKKTKTNYANKNKNAIQEDNTLGQSQLKFQKSNDNIFKTQKNLSKFNSSSTTNMMKNNKNINDKKNNNNNNYSSKRYHIYLQKKNDNNKTTREDNSKSREIFFKDNTVKVVLEPPSK